MQKSGHPAKSVLSAQTFAHSCACACVCVKNVSRLLTEDVWIRPESFNIDYLLIPSLIWYSYLLRCWSNMYLTHWKNSCRQLTLAQFLLRFNHWHMDEALTGRMPDQLERRRLARSEVQKYSAPSRLRCRAGLVDSTVQHPKHFSLLS